MSKISIEKVTEIASLARLELTEQEKDKYQKDLSSILDMVEKLDEVDTDNIVALDGRAVGSKNIFREDKVISSELSRDELLKNAPEREDGFIKVKKVLE